MRKASLFACLLLLTFVANENASYNHSRRHDAVIAASVAAAGFMPDGTPIIRDTKTNKPPVPAPVPSPPPHG